MLNALKLLKNTSTLSIKKVMEWMFSRSLITSKNLVFSVKMLKIMVNRKVLLSTVQED